ncbi:MAG: hypothetical protein ACRD0E_08095, partial [Acidimicrobiales bacterium]
TLACREVVGPDCGDQMVLRSPYGPLSPSPSDLARRSVDGQVLPLNRTMLGNQRLPYVGRFAYGWHRLSTTDLCVTTP